MQWFGRQVEAWLLRRAQNATERVAHHLADRAYVHAPVDTSFMRDSILVTASTDHMTFYVVSPAFYSVYVELGHMSVGGKWVSPNPFFRRAIANTRFAFPSISIGPMTVT